MPERRLRAAILDLDGVLTDTARLHARAWKRMFDPFLAQRAQRNGRAQRPFDLKKDYLTYVDGKPRYRGVRSFLAARGIELPDGKPDDGPERETVCGLGNRKQRFFLELLASEGPQVYETSVRWVRELQRSGVPIGLASASKNAAEVLRRAKLERLAQVCLDGKSAAAQDTRGKPDPDLFLLAAKLLGAAPRQTLIIEDAVSGVTAARAGAFGLIIGIDRGGNHAALRQAGADLVVEDLGELTLDQVEAWFRDPDRPPPNLLAAWDAFLERLGGRDPVVALDYDGTLTPIVARPELARLPDSTRAALERLAERFQTLIISGRAREDVQALVGLDNLTYAGSHGFDIAGPGGARITHAVGAQVETALRQACAWLAEQLEPIAGILVEDKRFNVAVHYRLVEPRRVRQVERAVDQALARFDGLRKTAGKMVFELRPDLDWDKGKALLWLLEQIRPAAADDRAAPSSAAAAFPIYIGDDDTDEDAFAVLTERGAGVIVTDRPRPTRARFSLQDPREVEMFLRRLVQL